MRNVSYTHDDDQREQVTYVAQVRVAAPKGTPLAALVEELANLPETPANAPALLLEHFRHAPIIWNNQEHYSLYLPNIVPAQVQQHEQPALEALT